MSIIDTPFNTTSKISCLVSQGVRTVVRYYNFSNSRNFPDKCLQLAEAQALSAHALQTAVVFQQRQNEVTDFTELKGSPPVVERIVMRKTASANQPGPPSTSLLILTRVATRR